jgi:hypothetical protein
MGGHRHIALTLACFALAAGGARAAGMPGSDWLIVQSAADPLALVGVRAARRAPGARVMAGADCAQFRPGLFVLAVAADRRTVRARPAGAYVKHCTPRPGRPAAFGIAAVDASFAAMASAPVNFDGTDIVSVVRSGLLVRPWYVAVPDDPREGLRVAVDELASGRGPRRTIVRDCTGAEVARDANHIAVACVVEQVVDSAVYRTTVYRARDLVPIGTIPRCRRPRLVVAAALLCDAQAVEANGRIVVTVRRVPL